MFIFSCSFNDPCNEIKFSREFLKAIQQDKKKYIVTGVTANPL